MIWLICIGVLLAWEATMFEKNVVYDRVALLAAFGLKEAELPSGWSLEPGDKAVPPSKRLRESFKAATGRDL